MHCRSRGGPLEAASDKERSVLIEVANLESSLPGRLHRAQACQEINKPTMVDIKMWLVLKPSKSPISILH